MKLQKFLGVVVLCAVSSFAAAQGYPNKPIRLVVPFAPGGSSDAAARPIADRLGALLGQTVVVENRAGAQGVVGADVVARAASDGYTLLMMPGTHVLNTYLHATLPFDPIKDFTPVGMLVSVPFVFVTAADRPYSTLRGMLQYAEQHPEEISVGLTDALGLLAAESLKSVSPAVLTRVNYKGAPAIVTDVIGGHLSVGLTTPPVVMSFTKDKNSAVRPLAITSSERLASLPEIPTVSEATGVSGYDVATWYGIAGPANLPSDVVARLTAAISTVMADEEMRNRMLALGMSPMNDNSASAMTVKMTADATNWGRILKEAGVKP
ncbi:tripartite tricarboxylate transporter substrate binding protein [Alcaligenaceae bacterium]|nr:tripartite tricarboxylate transporter substrate binding protein [Alcaligenaceae bacterium]